MTQNRVKSQQVIISVNPHAGASDAATVVQLTKEAIENKGFKTEIISDVTQVKLRAGELQRKGMLRAVVGAGGDGTLALLANLLPPEIPLTILPQGTENLLAKYYGIKAIPSQIAQIVDNGISTMVDSGMANGKRFLLMASCGFDADVVTRVHEIRTGHSSRIKWIKPIVDAIRSYKYPDLRVFVDDQPQPFKVKWTFIFNFPCYAMGFKFSPMADPDDGIFDLCTFRRGHLITGLFYLLGVILGKHRNWHDTRLLTFRKIRIESDLNVAYQLDGDPGGVLPLEISVQPKSLRLLLPASTQN